MRRLSRVERLEARNAREVLRAAHPAAEVFAEWLRRIASGQGPRPAARGLTLGHAELFKLAEGSQVWREALRVTLEGRKT